MLLLSGSLTNANGRRVSEFLSQRGIISPDTTDPKSDTALLGRNHADI
jgi:hypothetical protein